MQIAPPIAVITPSVLRWAREDAGFSIGEAVKKLQYKNVTTETFSSWEAGNERPKYNQLIKISKLFRRPTSLFFLPEAPKESFTTHFRNIPTNTIDKISPSFRLIIRKHRVRQMDLEKLHHGHPPANLSAIKASISSYKKTIRNAKSIARSIRDLFGITVDDQKQWINADEAFKKWREVINDYGVWVFKDAFRESSMGYSGFYLDHDSYPVVCINNGEPATRQIFTLFHELGHFILGEGGILTKYDQSEVFCNIFAHYFLIPDLDLSNEQYNEDKLKGLAKEYKVSQEVILRRYCDNGSISKEEYDNFKPKWQGTDSSSKNKKSGGNYYASQKAYLGRFLEIAFQQYNQQKISETQLAEYLGVKEDNLGQLELQLYRLLL